MAFITIEPRPLDLEGKPLPLHSCLMPDVGPLGEILGIGTIYECDVCKKQFRLDWAVNEARNDTHWYEYFRPEKAG